MAKPKKQNLDEVRVRLMDLIDEETQPSKMVWEVAVSFLLELAQEIESRAETLRDENEVIDK
jgi:hypothetical protein